MTAPIVVAIDGPAGAGKSTVARRVAERLGYLYVDSGAMYRAIALWALRNGTGLEDWHRLEQLALAADIQLEERTDRVYLNGEDVTEAIRGEGISSAASRVSTVPGVRRALVEKQKQFALRHSVVMEGRDIGTVVFPEARVKIFLDAAPGIRADRRHRQLLDKGIDNDPSETEREIRARDNRDRTRAEAPLLQAPDAEYVDATSMDLEEVEEAVLRIIRTRTSH
ncbi:MAG: (d)CMP kinase [Bryobacterales bacterium]|nr:(d)CMP kinase [Bryobacterales bacterium]